MICPILVKSHESGYFFSYIGACRLAVVLCIIADSARFDVRWVEGASIREFKGSQEVLIDLFLRQRWCVALHI
jgi:hypothetical protein